jgi:hypothetical protein
MASWFVSAPERAKRPVKTRRLWSGGRRYDAPINSSAMRFVIKLLLIFKILFLFKSEIIQNGYDYTKIMDKKMKQESYQLFQHATIETILQALEAELKNRNESPFWTDKIIPFAEAVLSVLIPLRDANMLFNPEGNAQAELTPELFFEWSDFVSLKMLAFTLQKSNVSGKLERTSLDEATCHKYKAIDLTLLGAYLSRYTVNLENESLDFPIANYNLHQGVSNVIKSLL